MGNSTMGCGEKGRANTYRTESHQFVGEGQYMWQVKHRDGPQSALY
jgi:hypothetical protein